MEYHSSKIALEWYVLHVATKTFVYEESTRINESYDEGNET